MAPLEEVDGNKVSAETVQAGNSSEEQNVEDAQHCQVDALDSSSSSNKGENLGRDFDLLVAFKRLDGCAGDLAKLRCVQEDFMKRMEDVEAIRQVQMDNFGERMYEIERKLQADCENHEGTGNASGNLPRQHAEAENDQQCLPSVITQVNHNFERASHEIRRHDLMIEEFRQSLAHAMHTLDLLSMELREQSSVVSNMQQSFESAELQAKLQTQQVTELHAALTAVQQNVTRTTIHHFEEAPRHVSDNSGQMQSQIQYMEKEIQRLHFDVEQLRLCPQDRSVFSSRAPSRSRDREVHACRVDGRVAVDVEGSRRSSGSPSRRIALPLSGASVNMQIGYVSGGSHQHAPPVAPLVSGSATPVNMATRMELSGPQPVIIPASLTPRVDQTNKERLSAVPSTPRQTNRACVSPPPSRGTIQTIVRPAVVSKPAVQSPGNQNIMQAQRHSHTDTSRARSPSTGGRQIY